MGIASEKYFAMEHRYPSRVKWLDKFGYDPKQLSHLLRIEEYLQRYLAQEPYKDCLLSKQADYLKAVKIGFYNLTEAREIAKKSYNNIHYICDDFIEKNKNTPIDSEINILLDDMAYQIMKISVKADFHNETTQGKTISSY